MEPKSTRSPKIRQVFPNLLDPSRQRHAVLGINAFGHDASVALVAADTGEVLYACAEERLSNVKHDWHYPIGSIHACCQEAERLQVRILGVAVPFQSELFVTKTLFREIDSLCPSPSLSHPLKEKLRLLFEDADYFSVTTASPTQSTIADILAESQLPQAVVEHITFRLTWYFNWAIKYRKVKEVLIDHLEGFPVEFVSHHDAHAASAFYSSGFEQASVLVIDGSGEADTLTLFRGDQQGLHRLSESGWPVSLGIFYLFATQHLGFSLGDEYKVMGMSAYGKPHFAPLLEDVMQVTEDGQLQMVANDYLQLHTLGGIGHVAWQFTDAFRELLPARSKQDPFEQKHFDFAASIQKITEQTGVRLAKAAMQLAGIPRLAIAGGVGLNGLMNESIRRESGCEDIFIYPAAADDGTAVGAAQYALFVSKTWQAKPAKVPPRLRACYFGHEVTVQESRKALESLHLKFSQPSSIHQEIAKALSEGQIVARCVGRAEFGPRALGHRSIMAHPGLATMKETLNGRVKHREEFRPFAPACKRDRVHEYFDMNMDAPFMLLIGRANEQAKARIPSVVHADGTARVQTVTPDRQPRLL